MNSTIFNCIQVLENQEYLVSGVTIDTEQNAHLDFITAKFDSFGDLLFDQHFGDSSHQTHTQYHSLSLAPGYFIQQAFGSRNDTACAIYHWFNENGDTIRSKYFRSPYLSNGQQFASFINPLYSLIIADSSVYLSTVIAQPVTGSDVCIFHLDKNGNELWHYIYSTDADPETCYAMIPWEDGVMAAIFKGSDDSDDDGLILLKLDANGTNTGEMDKSIWNNGSYGIRALLNDEALVCAGSYDVNINLVAAMFIWKMTYEGVELWSTYLSEQIEFDGRTISNLVTTIDGNYVVSGDFTWHDAEDSNGDILIAKIDSDDGSIFWSRLYHLVESLDDIHNAIDLKATPDGGVIFCGQATDAWSQNPNIEYPVQQGWICKLDACGCLVPGCDPQCVVGIQEFKDSKIEKFKVGPNPASDFLNIYLAPNAISETKSSQFTIYDMQGKQVKSFVPHRADVTYIVDVTDLTVGSYILKLETKDEEVAAMRVEVVR